MSLYCSKTWLRLPSSCKGQANLASPLSPPSSQASFLAWAWPLLPQSGGAYRCSLSRSVLRERAFPASSLIERTGPVRTEYPSRHLRITNYQLLARRFVVSALFLSLDDRDNVLVAELMAESDSLRLMLDGLSVDDRCLELFNDGPVDGIAEVFDGALV